MLPPLIPLVLVFQLDQLLLVGIDQELELLTLVLLATYYWSTESKARVVAGPGGTALGYGTG